MMNIFKKNNILREEYAQDIFMDKDSIAMSHSINEINDNGFIFEKNSFVVAQAGCFVAFCRKYEWGDFAAPVITVDSLFGRLSAESQEFIIAHEIGHFINGDLDRHIERNDSSEIAADAYAVSKYGKEVAITALKETLNLLKKLDPQYRGESEFLRRIEKIKAM